MTTIKYRPLFFLRLFAIKYDNYRSQNIRCITELFPSDVTDYKGKGVFFRSDVQVSFKIYCYIEKN